MSSVVLVGWIAISPLISLEVGSEVGVASDLFKISQESETFSCRADLPDGSATLSTLGTKGSSWATSSNSPETVLAVGSARSSFTGGDAASTMLALNATGSRGGSLSATTITASSVGEASWTELFWFLRINKIWVNCAPPL